MGPTRRAFSPLLIAAADLAVGGLLYQQASVLLGLLLIVCGLSVLITAASEPLSLVGSVLWRYLSDRTAE